MYMFHLDSLVSTSLKGSQPYLPNSQAPKINIGTLDFKSHSGLCSATDLLAVAT